MDAIPYDFIDRVFAKLDATNHKTIKFQSPFWKEAARVYKKKLQILDIIVSITSSISYQCLLRFVGRQDEDEIVVTFDNLVGMDDRFIRIARIQIQDNFGECGEIFNDVENLPQFIRFFSRFTVDQLILCDLTQELTAELSRNELKATHLLVSNNSGIWDYFKNYIGRHECNNLTLLDDDSPPEVKNDLEAFVCRPAFKSLTSSFRNIDTDWLTRIVAYWRTMDSPWESAEIHVREPRNHILAKQLRQWLGGRSGAARVKERRGEHCFWIGSALYDTILHFDFISDVS